MKRLLYSIFCLSLVAGATGCSDFLDTENLYNKNLDTFYKTPQDISEAMNGVYNALFISNIEADEHIASSLMSDLMLGGGGPDDVKSKSIDTFLDPAEDTYKDLWVQTFNGVYRANAIIEAVSTNDFSSFFDSPELAEQFKNKSLGEAYFMRGFLMFRAAKFFGGLPLIPTTESDRKVPRSTIPETYAFIAQDMLSAIDYLPEEDINSISLAEYGHANIWVAKSYLARIFLFYTGYMTNIEKSATSEIALAEGTLTKEMVVSNLNDVIEKSGHELVADFRNLWPYSHVNTSAKEFDAENQAAVLPWAEENNLAWAGQDGPNSEIGTGNKEVIFALRYGLGNWEYDSGTGQKYNNRTCLYFGVRGNSMVPFGEGWGQGTVHKTFYNEWSDEDIRKEGSVLVLGNAEQGTGSWVKNKGDNETGLMNKKYTTLQHSGVDGVKGMFYYLYNMKNADPMQLWAAQDFYYIRFADVLLMHSELTETADGMNKVRARAGLPAESYTLENLKAERMHELAFEGLRWFDLVRWGDVENSSSNYFEKSVEVSNSGAQETYTTKYRPETKGLVSIPESEIRLSNGVYQQNPGW